MNLLYVCFVVFMHSTKDKKTKTKTNKTPFGKSRERSNKEGGGGREVERARQEAKQ